MNIYIPNAIFFISLILLVILAIIDLRDKLLPNIYVFPYAVLGLIFHISTNFSVISLSEMILGGLAGMSTLLIIRWSANKYYKQDTLGLGDIKLIGAAGLWLGIHNIFLALSLGALLGVLHGLTYAHFTKATNLSKLSIPAGPGFIIGIIIIVIIKFYWT